ncbi:Fic family protein [Vineibacter terrae]|uniref:Fic family protein n=1 Tax=Vineibacter terrae TaxID=2586908 RepID=A0A5C8PQN2_9HYPH|nr:Fic family protein [Vineibacter terrae]TXL77090.1 Fic family protein [Vineibacter terrae]
MSDDDDGRRHSRADEPEIVRDPEAVARREVDNGLRQFDHVVELVKEWVEPERTFKLRPSMIQALHRTALDGLSTFAGNWRPAGVAIKQSKHVPPGAHLVAQLVEEMCDYVNDNWNGKPAAHLSAYVLWRLNWIHPFSDGNGRTSRAVSYLILCIKSGNVLPGDNTVPAQIKANMAPYYDALERADERWEQGKLDISDVEELVSATLATQLADYHRKATGNTVPTSTMQTGSES